MTGIRRESGFALGDEHAQFLIMLAETCAGARLAHLPVEVVLKDGTTIRGDPAPPASARADDEMAEIGYRRQFDVAGRTIQLADVVGFTVRLTAPSARWRGRMAVWS